MPLDLSFKKLCIDDDEKACQGIAVTATGAGLKDTSACDDPKGMVAIKAQISPRKCGCLVCHSNLHGNCVSGGPVILNKPDKTLPVAVHAENVETSAEISEPCLLRKPTAADGFPAKSCCTWQKSNVGDGLNDDGL